MTYKILIRLIWIWIAFSKLGWIRIGDICGNRKGNTEKGFDLFFFSNRINELDLLNENVLGTRKLGVSEQG